MPTERHNTTSQEATERLGVQLSAQLRPGDVLLLEGDLAAGKTTLVRGIARGLEGDSDLVTSPSFVLLQSYPCRAGGIAWLHHVDLYRLADQISELRELGLEEPLSDPEGVVAVEWPKNTMATWLPADARLWRIRMTITASGGRDIDITPPSESNS